jgi:hypothetical protein
MGTLFPQQPMRPIMDKPEEKQLIPTSLFDIVNRLPIPLDA